MLEKAYATLAVALIVFEARSAKAQAAKPANGPSAVPQFQTAPTQGPSAPPNAAPPNPVATTPVPLTPPNPKGTTPTSNGAPQRPIATTPPPGAAPPVRNARHDDDDDDDDDDDKHPRGLPETLPFEDGGPPNGYHVETFVRPGQVISNGIVFGVSYALAAYTAVETKEPALAIPLVGPMFLIQANDKSPSSALGNLVLYSDAIAQTVSAGFIAAAFLFPAKEFVRNDIVSGRTMHIASWSIVPAVLARSSPSLVLSGTLF